MSGEGGEGGTFAAVARRLGHDFADAGLLRRALTHTSGLARGRAAPESYERLEFLGDRVLGLVIADEVHRRYPQAAAGELALRYNALVRRETLAAIARDLELGEAIQMSSGEAAAGGRDKPAILADACEALLGALFLDGGMDAARRFIETHWAPRWQDRGEAWRDAKSRLQEWAQGRGLAAPAYRQIHRSGPDHNPSFAIEARLADGRSGSGEGATKRQAEQAAAVALLALLGEQS